MKLAKPRPRAYNTTGLIVLSAVRKYRAGAVDLDGGVPQPRATDPGAVTAVIFELDLGLEC